MDSYRIVRRTTTLYGEQISTVWLGLNQSYTPYVPGIPPLIFETILFAPKDADEKRFPHNKKIQRQYHTQTEAVAGHEELCRNCLIPPRWRSFILGTLWGKAEWKI